MTFSRQQADRLGLAVQLFTKRLSSLQLEAEGESQAAA
jgi:hypothetical protein